MTKKLVKKSVPEGSIVAGNPAKVISTVENYIEKNRTLSNAAKMYDSSFTIQGNISHSNKGKMYEELVNGIGFIE